MSLTQSKSWREYLPYYQEVGTRLERDGWLANGWHFFPASSDEFGSVTAQLGRDGWYNENHFGIHFDSAIGDRELQSGTVKIMLHCHKGFPQPAKFCRAIVAACAETVQGWENAELDPASTFQPIVLKLPLDEATLTDQLANGFRQMAQLAPHIDRAIAEALADKNE